jgi:hypothetical protein
VRVLPAPVVARVGRGVLEAEVGGEVEDALGRLEIARDEGRGGAVRPREENGIDVLRERVLVAAEGEVARAPGP